MLLSTSHDIIIIWISELILLPVMMVKHLRDDDAKRDAQNNDRVNSLMAIRLECLTLTFHHFYLFRDIFPLEYDVHIILRKQQNYSNQ